MKRRPSVEDVDLCDFNWNRFLRVADEFPHQLEIVSKQMTSPEVCHVIADDETF